MHPTKEKIALLNDEARKGLLPESTKMLLTRMVAALPEETVSSLRRTAAEFDAFTEDNDPYRERDFGPVELEGELESTDFPGFAVETRGCATFAHWTFWPNGLIVRPNDQELSSCIDPAV